ncbi:MAG: AsmA-like C-terminal region-containing protein, partial [Terrimicrobiaceae bacterium]|nr:AsmA-like C-terminal region-containing protein [Terrimicrobiaceae bacterium]
RGAGEFFQKAFMVFLKFIRALARGVMALSLLLIFVGLPVGLAWVRHVGIGFGVAGRVSEELSRGELDVRVGKVSFDIFRGFVAEGVRVAEKSTGREVASLSRVAVTPRLSELVRGRISIERVSLAGADGELLISAEGRPEQPLRFSRLEGDAWLMEDHVRVPFLKGSVQGLRIEADALIETSTGKSPGNQDAPGPGMPSASRDLELQRRVLGGLVDMDFPDGPPMVRVSLRGSMSRLAAEHFELRCGAARGKGWSLAGVEAAGSWDGNGGRLDRLEVRDSLGQLKLWGTVENGRAEFEGLSTLDPGPWLKILAPKAPSQDVKFQRPPEIAFQGRWSLPPSKEPPTITGNIAARGLAVRGARLDSLETGFAWKPGTFLARGAEIRAGGGEARADFQWSSQGIRLRLASLMRPGVLAPALDEKLRATLALFEFRDPPALEILLEGPAPAELEGQGHLRLGRSAMRGVWVDSLESRVSVAKGAVTYQDFLVKKGKGQAAGTFTYDFRNQLVRLQNVVSDLQPVDALMWADPKIAESVRPYRFVEGPLVKADGVVFMKETSRNALGIQLEARRGLDYDLLGRTLRFDRASARLRLDGTNLQVKVSQAALMGGQARFHASLSLNPARPEWEAEVTGEGVDFPSLTRLYFGYESSKGVVGGRYSFRSRLGQEMDMKGKGWVRVEDGNVFAIPLFGPLSEIISKVLPGVGYETARLATADFEIANRRIRTRNLAIEGGGFSLYGEGEIGFPSGDMDMSIRLNARGIPGIVFFPVSKLFEYVSDGTFSDPRWRPKLMPRLPLPVKTNGR